MMKKYLLILLIALPAHAETAITQSLMIDTNKNVVNGTNAVFPSRMVVRGNAFGAFYYSPLSQLLLSDSSDTNYFCALSYDGYVGSSLIQSVHHGTGLIPLSIGASRVSCLRDDNIPYFTIRPDYVSHAYGEGNFALLVASKTQYALTQLYGTNDLYLNLASSWSSTRTGSCYLTAYGKGSNDWNVYNMIGHDGTNAVNIWATGDLKFQNYVGSVVDRMVIKSDGMVGIAEENPTTQLYLTASDNSTALTIKINAAQADVTGADTFLDFRSTTGSEATIVGTGAAGVIAYNTFTGSHFTECVNTNVQIGQLLEATGGLVKDGAGWVNSITTLEGTNIVTRNYTASPKSQVVKTRVCSTRKSKSAWGIYLGRDKEGRDMVGSIGTGFLDVENKGKDIEVGDWLMSSDARGRAELQVNDNDGTKDDLKRNYTIGKALQPITWGTNQTHKVIAVTLHGG